MKTTLRFVFALALVVFLSACSHTKGGSCFNPAAPGCGGDNGGGEPPDQTGLEPLGDAAPKHYLKDANGNDTTMWARLLWVNPPRRSVMPYGNVACPGKCFQFQAEIGKDAEPKRSAEITIHWSDDCVTPSPKSMKLGGVTRDLLEPGESKVVRDQNSHFFDTTLKCLLVEGRHGARDDNGAIVGRYFLVLDYQDPPR